MTAKAIPKTCASVDAHFVRIFNEVLRVTDHAMMALTMLDSVANHQWIKIIFERPHVTKPPTLAIATLLSGSMALLVNNCEILTSTTGRQVTLRRLINLAGWLTREERNELKRLVEDAIASTHDIRAVRNGYTSHRWEGEESFEAYSKFDSTQGLLIVKAAYEVLRYVTPFPGREMLMIGDVQQGMREHCECIAATAALCFLNAQSVKGSLNDLIGKLLPTKSAEVSRARF